MHGALQRGDALHGGGIAGAAVAAGDDGGHGNNDGGKDGGEGCCSRSANCRAPVGCEGGGGEGRGGAGVGWCKDFLRGTYHKPITQSAVPRATVDATSQPEEKRSFCWV
jgi:hypothetical protein